jgi:hypothetical protein
MGFPIGDDSNGRTTTTVKFFAIGRALGRALKTFRSR